VVPDGGVPGPASEGGLTPLLDFEVVEEQEENPDRTPATLAGTAMAPKLEIEVLA